MMGHGKVSEPFVSASRYRRRTGGRRAPSVAMTQHQLLVTSIHCSPRISSQLVFKCSRAQSLPTLLQARIPQRRTFKRTPARAYRIQMSASIRFRAQSGRFSTVTATDSLGSSLSRVSEFFVIILSIITYDRI